MDKLTIRDFWQAKAKEGTTRWTKGAMLEFELDRFRNFIPAGAVILDLGSGFGELSRGLCPPDGRVIAVDAEPGMASGFDGDDRFSFTESDVVSYAAHEQVDVVLLFGVVTYLTEAEEEQVYDAIRDAMRADGVALIKNQCADEVSFEVDTQSEALGARYVGRYPTASEQRDRLLRRFESVEVIAYPPAMKQHVDSTHLAFACAQPRRSN